MRWIYILRCNNDIIYVRETTRLYTRLIEHNEGKGSIITKENEPYKIRRLVCKKCFVNDNDK